LGDAVKKTVHLRHVLESGGHKYIIGARIKNESEEIKRWVLSLDICFVAYKVY
jgi:hypothetical protein